MTEQTTVPMDEEQALFPKTPKEIADHFLQHFQDDVESAEKSLVNARKKLREAIVLRDEAELNLMRAIEAEKQAKTTESTAEEEYEDGHLIESPPLQIEGEVEDAEVVDEEEEQRLVEEEANRAYEKGLDDLADEQAGADKEMPPDALEAQIWVIWPDAEQSIDLKIGPLTRFGEITANYLNAHPEADFLARYVISDASGTTYDPKSVIGSENYGCEFFIEREVALKKEEA